MVVFIPELNPDHAEAGIYIVASNHQNFGENNKVVCKIGRASNLSRRLNAYGICFPDGCRILGLCILPVPQGEEGVRENLIKITAAAETKIHRFLTEKGVKWIYPNTDSVVRISRKPGKGEYFVSTVKQLQSWFVEVLQPLAERIYVNFVNPEIYFNPLSLEGELTKTQKTKRANLSEEQQEQIRNPSVETATKAFEQLSSVLNRKKTKKKQKEEQKETRKSTRKRKATSKSFNADDYITKQLKILKSVV